MGKSPDELDSDISDYEGKKNERPPTPLNTTTQRRLKRTKLNFKRKGLKKQTQWISFEGKEISGEEFKSNLMDHGGDSY